MSLSQSIQDVMQVSLIYSSIGRIKKRNSEIKARQKQVRTMANRNVRGREKNNNEIKKTQQHPQDPKSSVISETNALTDSDEHNRE